tara:strand:+ start:22 stop:228 length:207 start_codon:yes stop_codon:yes gene_type:complete
MKLLLLSILLVSCATPQYRYTKAPHKGKRVKKLKKADKVERCVVKLIGNLEVNPIEASKICIDIRRNK